MTYYRKFYEIVKCPICDGQGVLNKPFWVSGDQETWVDNKIQHICHCCNGKKVIKQQLVSK